MRTSLGLLLLLSSFASSLASAQVTGGQAPPEPATATPPPQPEDIDVPCPLLVQVSLLPTKPGGRSLLAMPLESTQTFKTRQYVCDKARVEYVRLAKRKASHDKIRVVVTAGLSTDWFAQRVTMTLGLYDGDKQLKSEAWKLRIGHDNFVSGSVFGASSKAKEIEVELSQPELEALFAEGHAPTVKVLVAIND